MFNTPILYLIFNRPDLVESTFKRIKEIKPKYLYIAADGPREVNQNDQVNCKKCRDFVLANIDWTCDVKTLFRDKNFGCKYAVSSAINWFFENVEAGIILEDDCLPNGSFFEFCEYCLNKFSNEKKIMHVSGNKFSDVKITESYFFSKYINIWGWATWRRAWLLYDKKIENYPNEGQELLKNVFLDNIKQRKYWKKILDRVYSGETNTWDYQWTYSCWKNKGLSVNPAVNLVSNIGFGEDATHLSKVNNFANLQSSEMQKPYTSSIDISLCQSNDIFIANNIFKNKPYIERMINRLTGKHK